jgi:hypothetical protein
MLNKSSRWTFKALIALIAMGSTLTVSAQTATTRAARTVNTSQTIWYKPVDRLGNELSTAWQQYGYVKFDVEIREPAQGSLVYSITRTQPVATAANTTLRVVQSGCVGENANSRIRCYYTTQTTVAFATTGIKQTSSWKAGGGGSVEAGLPSGAKVSGKAEGEGAASTEQNITPTLTFQRSFEFVVQLRNACTNNPGFSVYLQGNSEPFTIYSQCTTPVPQQTKYCGGGRTPNRMANGQVDGEWVWWQSVPSNWTTLQDRYYTLERNGVPVTYRASDGSTQTLRVKNTCAVGFGSVYTFDQVDWYDADNKRVNWRCESNSDRTWCNGHMRGYRWNWQEGDYTDDQGDIGTGGVGYPGSGVQPQPITAPSYNY